MAQLDHYKPLGVAEAQAPTRSKSYRKLAKKYHPDATGGDKVKEPSSGEITEAYEVFSDEQKAQEYDEAAQNLFGGGMPGGGFPGGGFPVVSVGTRRGSHRRRWHRHQPEDILGQGGFGDLFAEWGQDAGAGARPSTRGTTRRRHSDDLTLTLAKRRLARKRALRLDPVRPTSAS